MKTTNLNTTLWCKYAVLTALLLAVSIFSGKAQNRRDKIDALHTSYITEKVNLTDAEAKAFWPVYDNYRNEMDEIKKQHQENKESVQKAGGVDKMSDDDVKKLIISETDIKSRELELEKEYVSKFEQVLPLRKVAKFYIAEEQFKMYLLKQLVNRRNGGNGNERQPEFVPQ